MSDPIETVWQGRFITTLREGRWEYVMRNGDITAAVIVAIDDDHLILVEQYRIPIAKRCIELPAGLVGDDHDGESIELAAIRELEEETGYRAEAMELLGEYVTSPGMVTERFTLVRARGLDRVGEGGGVPGEDITVHRVPLAGLTQFIAARRAEGMAIDSKLLILLGPIYLKLSA